MSAILLDPDPQTSTPVKRFAFKGRVSTEDNQDPDASRNWQISRSRALIEPAGGIIVAEYFDIGQSRSLPWKRRPRAAQLLADLADPGRGFDAVVIGEPQRAFYGNQYSLVMPVFTHYGVELWVPEVGGPIDPDSEAHDLIMSVFGGLSKGERNRVKLRVRAGLSAIAEGLTRDQIPSPSQHDRARNRHRTGEGWSKSAVRAIVRNPRYTGRQVWNKQRKDEILLDVNDVAAGYETRMRWNQASSWIWSDTIAHQPLIPDG